MRITLKPLSRQVVVITGASSGIGLVTARMAAGEGAKVVVAARNAPALHRLARDIEVQGGQALAVPTDVTHDNASAATRPVPNAIAATRQTSASCCLTSVSGSASRTTASCGVAGLRTGTAT